MAEETPCCVCLEAKFNKTVKSKTNCIYCNETYCRSCLKQYVEASSEDMKCASCKRPWTDENLSAMLPRTYVEGELRRLKTKRISDREKQLLPDTMEVAMNYQKEYKKFCAANEQILKLEAALGKLKLVRDRAERRSKAILTGEALETVEKIAEESEEKERFFKPCPKEGCNGFLSTRWKCGICDVRVCKDCLEIIKTDDPADHTCKPEDLASALEVKKNCKDCPKCHRKIYKISGCDQLWCTGCHTAFSWNTGKIDSGRVHNPHYYEWMAQNGAEGNVRLEMGACGVLDVQDILLALRNHKVPPKEYDKLVLVHRSIVQANEMLLEELHLPDIEARNREVRIKFIVNQFTKEEFERQLFLRDKDYQRTKDFRDLHNVLAEEGMAILRDFVRDGKYVEALQRLESLNDFVDKQMKILNTKYKTKKQFNIFMEDHGPRGRQHRQQQLMQQAFAGMVIGPQVPAGNVAAQAVAQWPIVPPRQRNLPANPVNVPAPAPPVAPRPQAFFLANDDDN